MAIIDNTLAAQVPTFDPATPLAQAAKIRAAEIEQQQQQFKLMQAELGSEARGLQTFVNSPEFPQRWAESIDRLAQKGVLPPQAVQQWRNTPSPLLLKSIIAQTENPELTFRREEAARSQKNSDRVFAEQRRQFNESQDYDPDERAALAEKYGLKPGTPEYAQFALTGSFPTRSARQLTDLESRALAAGLQPGTNEFKEFMLRGGKNADVSPSAAEKKEIFKSEDELPNLEGTATALKRALELNDKTFTGYTAGVRGRIGSKAPGGSYIFDKDAAEATLEWEKTMSQEAISTMADSLKGATTDFELNTFKKDLADPETPPHIRERIIKRMLTLAEKQTAIKQRRIRELPGGTYFKSGADAAAGKPAAPDRFKQLIDAGATKEQAYATMAKEGY